MIPSFGSTKISTTFPEERLALTQRRPNYRPTGTHPSPRYASVWKSTNSSGLLSSTSRQALSTHWSLMENTATLHWVATRGRSWSARKQARIGILGNNEKNCATTDSRIGFGTGGYQDDTITCGNDAIKGHTSDNGEKHIKAMGYILVQWQGNRWTIRDMSFEQFPEWTQIYVDVDIGVKAVKVVQNWYRFTGLDFR